MKNSNDPTQYKKILVTGGAGFIGSHVVEHYQGRAEIVVLDNFRTGHLSNLKGLAHHLIKGSITDYDAVNEAMRDVDCIFHLAAMISVPESMQCPQECVNINTQGLLNILESAKNTGVQKLVFASSASIYGNNPTVPKTEEMLPEPQSPYAVTKLDGEHYLEIYRREHGLDTASLRFFNVFGPRQDPASSYAAAIPTFIRQAIAGDPITIFGNGEQTRDFIYVEDIVSALSFIAERQNINGAFNIGYADSITIRDLVQNIVKLTGSSSEIKYLPQRIGDVKHSRASISKLNKTGFNACHSLNDGLIETLKYFENHPT
jgi:UDP-glucose 4-epimerase